MAPALEPDALAVLLGPPPPRGRRGWLREGLRDGVRSGLLPAGARLPGSRVLAGVLGVSRGLVTEVVDQLVAEGYLTVRARSGAHVRTPDDVPATAPTGSPAAAVPHRTAHSAAPARSPGTPDLRLFPVAAWGRAARQALATLDVRDLGYPDPRGHPTLRGVLAGYLARTRGAVVDPERVLVVAGAAQAFAVLALATCPRGRAPRWVVEHPGSAGATAQLRSHGVDVVGVPVDRDGLDVASLPHGVDVVLVTPAHQYPTGVLLAPARRHELIARARRQEGGFVVAEDDYDADLRYDGVPVACLQGHAPDVVALVGSVSKSLAPGLRLGWCVVSDGLVDAVAAVKRDLDLGCPVIEQLTLARFLDSGGYDRHLRRVRTVYRRRREAVLAALAADGWRERDGAIAAGLHVYVERDGDARVVGFA